VTDAEPIAEVDAEPVANVDARRAADVDAEGAANVDACRAADVDADAVADPGAEPSTYVVSGFSRTVTTIDIAAARMIERVSTGVDSTGRLCDGDCGVSGDGPAGQRNGGRHVAAG
jgi:hypothetical protein